MAIAPAALARVAAGRDCIEQILAAGQTVYGVNTGFGKLSDVRIPAESLAQLQINLVRSHAGGVGQPLASGESRAMLLLRANVLAKGFSGVPAGAGGAAGRHAECRRDAGDSGERLGGRKRRSGSAGAPGAGGDWRRRGVLRGRNAWPAARRCVAPDLQPLELAAKEGLALLNGTQAMTAVGALAVARARRLVRLADLAGAMSLEALMGTPAAFDARIHQARPHAGQIAAAAHLIAAACGDRRFASRIASTTSRVQDAYCLRCMPQVHGAVRDVLDHVAGILEIESGSATDNPLVFPQISSKDARPRSGAAGREFSWGAAGLRVRLRGHRADRSGRDHGAAHRPAAQSRHQRGAAAVSFAGGGTLSRGS